MPGEELVDEGPGPCGAEDTCPSPDRAMKVLQDRLPFRTWC